MLLDVEAVAKRLGGIAPYTVRRLIWSGAIPATRIGRRVMVHHLDLAAYVEQQRKPVPPTPEPAR